MGRYDPANAGVASHLKKPASASIRMLLGDEEGTSELLTKAEACSLITRLFQSVLKEPPQKDGQGVLNLE